MRNWMKLAALVVAMAIGAHGQAAYTRALENGVVSASAGVFTHTNLIGELNVSAEYLLTGTPTITSIVLKGCMRGGTCDTLNTYTTSANTTVHAGGFVYDNYTVTPTWSGCGTPPCSVTINWTGSANSSPGGGAGTQAGAVQGVAATGTAVSGAPVLEGGSDGTNVQPFATDTSGRLKVIGIGPTTATNAVATLSVATTNSTGALTASSQSALTTAVVVKAGPGNLYGLQVTNGAGSVCFLEFINAASAPTLGTAATYSFAVPANGTLTVGPLPIGLSNYATGISVGMATTYNGATPCGTAATAVIFSF